MEYLIILLITLRTHPIFSLLLIIALCIIALLILPLKFRLPIISFMFIFFTLSFVNVFIGHFIINALLNNYGEKGQGVIVDTVQTSNYYNNEQVLRYDIIINTNENLEIPTYCLSSDFNIFNETSFNSYYYPKSGVKFNIKYLQDYPRAFLIIVNNDSEYSKGLNY
ncbi:hypothetical protein [Clostridium saccharoperbutylacetonicum]|uniref:hypothetical protein n=1 Tax=Clostridium saccharoperbutylacetonicum TaxID=36745 RepID=UPI0039EA39B5